MTVCTSFFCNSGTVNFDIGCNFVEKCVLINNYPWLLDSVKPGTSLWAWGSNNAGQLGNLTTINNSSPVQTISGGNNWRCVSASRYHTVATKSDGTLWTWGCGGAGRLGNGLTINQSSPVQTVGAATNWKQPSAGQTLSAAIKTDGSLWLWGNNGSGQLGTQTVAPACSPVQTISATTNWKTVSVAGNFAVATKLDGTLWTWGQNAAGQLGITTTTNRSSPVQTTPIGTNWRLISNSTNHVVTVKTDGVIWTWGCNYNGELGDGTSYFRSAPVQITTTNTNWKMVSASIAKSSALANDGTLYVWGSNGGSGEIGVGAPVVIFAPTTTWFNTTFSYVSSGENGMSGVAKDGTLWTWGDTSTGAAGDNQSCARQISPVQTVAGGNNWKGAWLAADFQVALRDSDD